MTGAAPTAPPSTPSTGLVYQPSKPGAASSVSSHSSSVEFPSGDLGNPGTDSQFIIVHRLRSFEAFSRIALLLQLPCTINVGIHVPSNLTLPSTLEPLPEQQVIPHMVYIDMLPWPSLRRNILANPNTINDVEFANDMQSDQLKVWGSIPWDPHGWEVSEAFINKWWFVLDASILQSTNFWRGQRGERPIGRPEKWNRFS